MKHETIDYKAIGQRLRAYRIAASLNAEQIADYIGISRAAVYRLEKGDIVKIETLEKLAILLNTSLHCLLGVDSEYYSNAAGFFERMKQLEESSTDIYSHFSPFSYLLTSEQYDDFLRIMLTETEPGGTNLRAQDINVLTILSQRKKNLLKNTPKLFNLIGIQQIEQFLHLGMIGSLNLSPSTRMERVLQARKEIKHLIEVVGDDSSNFEISISKKTIPSLTFQIFYQRARAISVAVSPFRLGEFPNISTGIATVTNSQEAINTYRIFFNTLWDNSAKKDDAIKILKTTLDRY
ncbi:helix-turn-helix domain-containing protein [Aeromonas jandaei]